MRYETINVCCRLPIETLAVAYAESVVDIVVDVRDSAHPGRLVTATCVTSSFNDGSWLRDTPWVCRRRCGGK